MINGLHNDQRDLTALYNPRWRRKGTATRWYQITYKVLFLCSMDKADFISLAGLRPDGRRGREIRRVRCRFGVFKVRAGISNNTALSYKNTHVCIECSWVKISVIESAFHNRKMLQIERGAGWHPSQGFSTFYNTNTTPTIRYSCSSLLAPPLHREITWTKTILNCSENWTSSKCHITTRRRCPLGKTATAGVSGVWCTHCWCIDHNWFFP